MRNVWRVGALAVGLMVIASGCSWTQVQVWFQARGVAVSESQAREVADKVNAQRAHGCDEFYVGGCIPSNVTSAYCVGHQRPDGHPVHNPTVLNGWNHFGLVADAQGVVCPDIAPVGALDFVTDQTLTSGIYVSGWVWDPDGRPLALDAHGNVGFVITVDGVDSPGGLRHTNLSRPDVAAAGYGQRSGFAFVLPAQIGPRSVCLQAESPPMVRTTIGCRDVWVGDTYDTLSLANAVRRDRGLAPFGSCPAAQQIAMDHSQMMAASRSSATRVLGSTVPELLDQRFGTGNAAALTLVAPSDPLNALAVLARSHSITAEWIGTDSEFGYLGIARADATSTTQLSGWTLSTSLDDRYWSFIFVKKGAC